MKMQLSFSLTMVFGFLLSSSTFAASSSEVFYENSSGSPIIGLLQGAKDSIDMEVYTMNDPNVDQEIRNAVQRGVKVNIVEESAPVGAACHAFGGSNAAASKTAACLRLQDLVSYVNQSGGKYVPFPKELCGTPNSNCVQHGKMAIIDGSVALISTGNFDTTSLCDVAAGATTCDRDYTILSYDPSVISSLTTVFNHDLAGEASDLSSLASSRVTVSPDSMEPIINFIKSAKQTLQIETQYLKDPTMNQAIIDVAKSGVEVSVMVASPCSFGTPKASVVTKWNTTFSAFEDAGVKARIFDGEMKVGGEEGYLHAKAIIVDGVSAWVGSVNGSTAALSNNREYGIFVSDADLVSKLNDFVSGDFSNSASESWEDAIQCSYEHGGK